MKEKWYPDIVDIIEDSILIYDTNVLLNVYRHSLVSSKRILDYMKKYENMIWLPYQVKKEFNKNKKKVKSVNLYKNLDKNLNSHLNEKRDKLFVELAEYEKKRFSKFPELKSKLESKFLEMNSIIKDYKNDIAEETGVYREFLEEVDDFLGSLLASDKVNSEMNMAELLEWLKEGELRYKYNLPPGYRDEKKEGSDKFGDLIIWKEIIKKASEISEMNIIFVTDDTKLDWFHKNSNGEVEGPRRELVTEFQHYNAGKKIIILPFESFIEEISNSTDSSDRDLLLELRMNNLIKRLPLEDEILDNLESLDLNDVYNKAAQKTTATQLRHLDNIIGTYGPNLEDVYLEAKGIKIDEDEIIYSVNAVVECDYSIESISSDVISDGSIYLEVIYNIELKRKLDDDETQFFNALKANPQETISITHQTIDDAYYIWNGDRDALEEDTE